MFLIGPVIEALEQFKDLDMDPTGIQAVIDTLTDNASDLDDGSFQRLHIAPDVFGGSETGGELGFHHGKAHQIVSDTILGVVADLHRFRDGVQNAVRLVETADEGNAADLRGRQAAVEVLVDSSGFSTGDQYEEQARNEHLTGADEWPGSTDGGDD